MSSCPRASRSLACSTAYAHVLMEPNLASHTHTPTPLTNGKLVFLVHSLHPLARERTKRKKKKGIIIQSFIYGSRPTPAKCVSPCAMHMQSIHLCFCFRFASFPCSVLLCVCVRVCVRVRGISIHTSFSCFNNCLTAAVFFKNKDKGNKNLDAGL